jgi:hypothetical protein
MGQHDVETAVNERGLHLGNNEWHETSLLYLPKQNFDGESKRDTNATSSSYPQSRSRLSQYPHRLYNARQEIEASYKQVKRFMAKDSKNFVLRFFYFAFACLLYSLWSDVGQVAP